MKIGRNDPCWCGSGQKYKKCHAAFDDRLTELKMKDISFLHIQLSKLLNR